MIDKDLCPCTSGEKYSICCKPFHEGESAPTAEKLMRSRYSAYVLCLSKYLIETTYPSKRKLYKEQDIIDWSKENKWLKLEILYTSITVVEFKAHYLNPDGLIVIHHERSTFTQEKGKWYYVKGTFL